MNKGFYGIPKNRTYEAPLSASYANNSTSASYALTASYAVNGGGGTIDTGSLTGSFVTLDTNQTITGAKTFQKTVSAGTPYYYNVTTNALNGGDAGDGGLSLSHTIQGSGGGTSLVVRSMSFGSLADWNGGTIFNHRVFNIASNVNTGTTVDNLDQIYLETGTPDTSNASNYRAIRINNSQGINRAGFVCNTLTGGGNNSYLVLGQYDIPVGNWVIWSNQSNSSYLQGGLQLGTSANAGYKLDVNGTTRLQNTLTISTGGANIVGTTTVTGSLGVTGSITVTNRLTVTGSTFLTAIITGSAAANNPSSSIMTIGGTIVPPAIASVTASAVLINPIMSSSAATQTLVALDIQPIYTASVGTPTRAAIRFPNQSYIQTSNTAGTYYNVLGTDGSSFLSVGNSSLNASIAGSQISFATNSSISFNNTGGATGFRTFMGTFNTLLQGGGTIADLGYRLQVIQSGSTSALTPVSGALFVSGSSTFAGSLNISGPINISTGSITVTSGSITMPNRPAFRVTGSGGATSATTTLSGSMTAVDYNQGSAWNNTTGVFTAPIAGLYQVNIVARTNSNSLGTISQVIVYKNDTNAQIMLEWAANTTVNHIGGSTISKLAVGDTLKAVVTVGTISFDLNDNFSVAYIG
jgi:hypothetical protein